MQYLQDLPDELDDAIRKIANRTPEERVEIDQLRIKQKKLRKTVAQLSSADVRILNEIHRTNGREAGDRAMREMKQKAAQAQLAEVAKITARLEELGPPKIARVAMVRILLAEALRARGVQL